MSPLFRLDSYDYPLPEEFIAQVPANPADTSRLLVRESDGTVRDTVFHTLPDEIDSDRVMFFNDSKVIRSRIVLSGARLVTKDGREKIFDGEIFFLEETNLPPWERGWLQAGGLDTSPTFKAMVYPGDYFPIGWTVYFGDIAFRVEKMVYEGRILRLLENNNPLHPHRLFSSPLVLTPNPPPEGEEVKVCSPLLWRRGVGGEAKLHSIHNDGFSDIWQILEHYGQLPLPPYIEYSKEKEQGYQTVFGEKRGSLAAPTASLHFTPRVLEWLKQKRIEQHKITLHVGLGTFKNIYEEDVRDYVMHAERAEVPVSIFETIANRKSQGKTILAVGTTVTRTLESLPYLWRLVRDRIECPQTVRDFWDATSLQRETNPLSSVSFSSDGETLFFSSALFIYGAYRFQVVDEIITNFHLPKSTLFMLVSSFLWLETTKALYAHAVKQGYRFFSFGDAMYLKGGRK